MRLRDIVDEYRRFGAVKAIQDLGFRALNRFVRARILKGLTIDTVDPEFLKCDKPYQGGFLDEAALTRLVDGRPEYEMSGQFLQEAFAKGDECYGFVDGSVLANYGWYSTRPTAVDAPGMLLHFDPHYVYMYKGYTHNRYRGQRLHSIAMSRALETYLAKRYRGLVSYVEWNNFSSLKSCYRMGYQDFGNIYLIRLFGKYLTYAGKGCAKYGFCLKPSVEESAEISHTAAVGARTE